jgi:hypothetical protein
MPRALQSQPIRYQLSRHLDRYAYADVSVARTDADLPPRWAAGQVQRTTYRLAIKLSPNCSVPPSAFTYGPTATFLEAWYASEAREIWIAGIERRSLAPGQSFAGNTYLQLLALTPDCKSIVLYNILNLQTRAVVESARDTTGWLVPAEGPLLEGLHRCGFQNIVGFLNGPAYLCVRASRQDVGANK